MRQDLEILRALRDLGAIVIGLLVAAADLQAVSPGGVTDSLKLWLKADGFDSAIVDGMLVDQWNDKSGQENHAIGDGELPIYRDNETDALNFNPTLRFDGVNDHLVTSLSALEGTTDYTFMAVGVREDQLSNEVLGTDLSNLSFSFGYLGDSTFVFHATDGGNGFATGSSPFGHQEPSLTPFLLLGTAGRGEEERNGQVTSYGATTGIFPDASEYYVGRGGLGYFNGRISEIVAYRSQLSAEEISRVKSYLALKYGLSLGQNGVGQDYVDSRGNVIWDAGNGQAYANGIAGIGQDELSGLDQKRSRSSHADGVVMIEASEGALEDGEFLLWGHNGDGVSFSAEETPSEVARRISREWFLQETGEVGAVDVTFDLRGLNFASEPDAGELYLLSDGDGDFGTGSTSLTASHYVDGIVKFTGVSEMVLGDGVYFTLGCDGCEVASPGGIQDELTLWLKADAGTSTTSDGARLVLWSDQSAGGNDATDGGDAPVFKNNEADNINFNPTVEFDGRDHFLQASLADLEGSGNYSLFAVGTTEGVSRSVPLGSDLPAEEFFFGYGDGVGFATFGFRVSELGGTLNLTESPFEAGKIGSVPYLLSGINSLGEEERSGVRTRSLVNENGVFPDASQYYIGRGGSDFYGGRLSELIVYRTELDGSAASRVKTYLALKYGLSLGQNDGEQDYVDSSGRVVWDASVSEGTYVNGIAGIGRDDTSGLNQWRSKSSEVDSMVEISSTEGGLDEGEFLIWSNNGGGRDFAASELPPGIDSRLGREWRIVETGEVGAVDIYFRLNLPLPTRVDGASKLRLLTGSNSDFREGSHLFEATSLDRDQGVAGFSAVPQDLLNDGLFFTVGIINETPVANDDVFTRSPNGGLTKIFIETLLANDFDPDGDPIFLSESNVFPKNSVNGATVTLLEGGRWLLYTPRESGLLPSDRFSYLIQDSDGAIATGEVTVETVSLASSTSNKVRETVQGSDIELEFRVIPRRHYVVQSTTDLSFPVSWATESGPLVADQRGRLIYRDLGAAGSPGAKFFRTQEVQPNQP